ncbi:MAG: hypothetical protein GY854_14135 [Deltaproteobacteria bacterium]|nr:hypothetical protein [Deltaproteobacteria bacterium]
MRKQGDASGRKARNDTEHDNSGWRRLVRLQTAIWFIIGLFYFAFDTERHGESVQVLLFVRALCWALIGGLLTTALCILYERFRIERFPVGWTLFIAVINCLVVSVVWLTLFNEIDGLIGFEPGYRPTPWLSPGEIFAEMFDRTLTLIVWHFIALSLVHSYNNEQERERVLRLEKLATEARMELLRGQLHPHFFFNSLNSAISLIDEDPDAAQRFLTRLSSLLRDTLTSKTTRRVPLNRELEFVRRYVEIEKVRFEEKLVFEEEIMPGAGAQIIPSLIVQPLVENAIKHGMLTSGMPLRVELHARLEGARLEISVSNTGRIETKKEVSVAAGEESGCGIGITNLRERLASELPGRHEFSLREDNGWVRASLFIDSVDIGTTVETEA